MRPQAPPIGAATPPADSSAAQPAPPTERSDPTAGFWSPVAAVDVVRAIGEYDRLGQEQFLAEHGFGRATAHLLIYRGRSYDPKAIRGVAYTFATGVRIGAHDFSGGVHGAAGVLRKLGFEVRDTRNPAGQQAGNRAASGGPIRPHVPAPAPARGVPRLSA